MLIIFTILLLLVYLYLGWKYPAIALVTSPFVAGTMIFIGAADQNTAVVVIAPCIFILSDIAILFSKPESESAKWPKKCAKWIVGISAILFLLITMGAIIGPFIVSGIMFFILLAGSIIAYGITSRHATDAYVISTIGSSMRQNLPLPMALESAAGGCTDKRSRILNGIQKWMVQGYSLSDSIRRGYPTCPGYALSMITAAERIGQLPRAIHAIETDMVSKADERRKIRPVHPAYPVILMVFTFFILLSVMTFVIPTFKAVLEELIEGAKLPAATRFLIGITNFVAYDLAWIVWPVAILVFIAIIIISIYSKFRPRRPDKPYLISRIGDFIKWHLPVLHNFEKNYSLVHVVELLRLSLNAGCSVNESIENTLSLDVNNCFKKCLRRSLKKVERGDNIASAIRESRLGSPLAWAFDEKVNQGNTPVILETLESFYRANYSYCVNLARFIMWPCLILFTGAIVGFVIFAIFSPTIVIITGLADQVIP